jgi:tripartite-type tricarboxylate transporter receptor subunit TctC
MKSLPTGLVAAVALAVVPFASALAQDFPSKPVRFVVPYAAGGSGDLLARLPGSKLSGKTVQSSAAIIHLAAAVINSR